MNAIRFVQLAILATVTVLLAIYFLLLGSGYLVFSKLLGFGGDQTLIELIGKDPTIPIAVAAALAIGIALEAVRVRIRQDGVSSN